MSAETASITIAEPAAREAAMTLEEALADEAPVRGWLVVARRAA